MITRQLFPEQQDAATGISPVTQTPTRKSGLPRKDADFMTTARIVSTAWNNNPQISLLWITPAVFAAAVTNYGTALMGRLSTGGERPVQTQTLTQLDGQINTAVTEVKVYIEKKYKKRVAAAHFAAFGIVKENKTYIIPRDRDDRLNALQLMKAAIDKEGFGNEEYGTAFWAGIYTSYAAAMETASSTDGAVSTGAADKNELKKKIKQTMKSLRCILQGNYPDTYKAVYREWGWQKEDY